MKIQRSAWSTWLAAGGPPAGWKPLIVVGILLLAAACGPSKKKQMNEQQAVNRFQLGSRFMQAGELRRAVRELTAAIELDPRNDRYHNGLGQVYLFLGEYDLAKEQLLRAIKLNPSFTESHHNLALVYTELGDYEDAEEEYRIALSNPAYLTPEKVYLNWGSTLRKRGDIDGALAKMRKAVALNPRYGRGHRELGGLLEERGDTEGALDEYLKAYAAMPQDADLNLKLGELYIRQENYGQARTYLEKVIEMAAPDSSEALRAQAFLEELTSG